MDTITTRPITARRDAPVICPACGRIVRRKARQQRYCSTHCRKRAQRAVEPLKILPHHHPSGGGTNPPKKFNGGNALQGPKSRSSLPREAWRTIVEVEVFGGRAWEAVVSSDGVTCEVAPLRPRALVGPTAPPDDHGLDIPASLRRAAS